MKLHKKLKKIEVIKSPDFASDCKVDLWMVYRANVSSSQNDSYIQDSACQKCKIGHIEGSKMEASKVIFYILQVSFHAIDS